LARHVVYCNAVIRSLSEAKRTRWAQRQSAEIDPSRHFGTIIYRIAKGSLDHLVGAREHGLRNGKADAT